MTGIPVTVVSSGGYPVTEVAEGGNPGVKVTEGGYPITLVSSGGYPMVLSGGGGGSGGDPDFANVVLLMGFEGANGATTFTDDSSYANSSWSANAGAGLNTALSKFGGSCLDLTGSAARLTRGSDTDFDIGASEEFCIEGFFRCPSFSGEHALFGCGYESGTNAAYILEYNHTTGTLQFIFYRTNNSSEIVEGPWSPATDTFHHIVAERDASNNIRVMANGAVIATETHGDAFRPSGSADSIGGMASNARLMRGYIDELRVTIGSHRYGGVYTVPTAPFPRS